MKHTHQDQHARAKALLRQFTGMKTVPSVATRLIRMIENDQSGLQEFEAVIKVDPTLVLRLLKLVNSAYFSLRTKIRTISEAVVYIGMDNLRNMIVLDAVKHLFAEAPGSGRFSRPRLWLHSAVTSICCQMISERIFARKGEDAFLCGLLHDIGLIVEDQLDRDRFDLFCSTFDADRQKMTRCESDIMGTTHALVGGLLTRQWELNPEVCMAVRQHHQPLEQVAPESLTGILQISEYLILRLGYHAFPDHPGSLSQALGEHIRQNIVAYRAVADDLPEEIQRAREIYDLEGNRHG